MYFATIINKNPWILNMCRQSDFCGPQNEKLKSTYCYSNSSPYPNYIAMYLKERRFKEQVMCIDD